VIPTTPTPTPPASPPVDAAVADAAAVDAALVPGHRHGAPPPIPQPTSPPLTPPPDAGPPATGYLQVVGEDLLRARVFVDGRPVGYVPNRIAVPLGHHRVEVERTDGTRLPAQDLDVTPYHTAAHPARPGW
jgi:hypothetical protein